MPASPDEILSLAYFVRVVEAKSFTGAAARLGVSKSVVSARVSALEDALGTRLLQRTTRKLALTPEGLALHEHAARMVAAADDAAAAGAADRPRGLLRVDAPVAFAQDYLAPPIAAYLERYPDVRVEITMSDRFIDLISEGVDVTIRIASRLAGTGLVARKLTADRTVLVAAPAYLARRGTPVVPEDLAQHDCLVYSLLKDSEEWTFRSPGGKQPIVLPIRARFQAGSGALLRSAALSGMGLAVLPTFMVAGDLSAGRLVRVIDAFAPHPLGIHAAYPQGKRVPAKTRAFVDLLAAWFRTPRW
jgi:DNA-binding transcriptional LysR family regulator